MASLLLHAGVTARADERKKLERLCGWSGRPVADEHLALAEKWDGLLPLRRSGRWARPCERLEWADSGHRPHHHLSAIGSG